MGAASGGCSRLQNFCKKLKTIIMNFKYIKQKKTINKVKGILVVADNKEIALIEVDQQITLFTPIMAYDIKKLISIAENFNEIFDSLNA